MPNLGGQTTKNTWSEHGETATVCGVSLAGEEPHHVPVSGENTELHQVPEHTEDLQQELLEEEEEEEGRGG